MPKRIGYIYERMVTIENCTQAVLDGTANLKKTEDVVEMRTNPEKYGRIIRDILIAGWTPEPVREKTINEGTDRKVRHLRIPTKLDHLIHVAIIRPIIPELIKRYDFYCCGSVPGRGPKRVHTAIRKWMGGDKPLKYAVEMDVRHAYENTTAEVVMRALRRFIKDECYLAEHEKILRQMGGTLAIGFQPSHWYFNLVMSKVDREVRGKGIHMVRYMDNYVVAGNNRRRVQAAAVRICKKYQSLLLAIKDAWHVFRTNIRCVRALSYRYFHGYTLMRKPLMYRISRSIRKAASYTCAHIARRVMGHIGYLRHINSYNYRNEHLYRVISIRLLKELISNGDRKRKSQPGNMAAYSIV